MIDDFTPTVLDEIAAAVATTAGVDAGSVEVRISAGSVVLTIVVRAPSTAAAAAAEQVLSDFFNDAEASTVMLSSVESLHLTVSSVTAIVAGSGLLPAPPALPATSPPLAPPRAPLASTSSVAVVAIAASVGIVVGLGAAVAIYHYRERMLRQREHTIGTPRPLPPGTVSFASTGEVASTAEVTVEMVGAGQPAVV